MTESRPHPTIVVAEPLENDRCPDVHLTAVRGRFAAVHLTGGIR